MLSQADADRLLAILKLPVGVTNVVLPAGGASVRVDLESPDGDEKFLLDMYRGRVNLLKGTYQTRARSTIILARLDFGGQPHRNPDGEEIPSPHLHLYREGYEHKWATALDASLFVGTDMIDYWPHFRSICNIAPSLTLSERLIA